MELVPARLGRRSRETRRLSLKRSNRAPWRQGSKGALRSEPQLKTKRKFQPLQAEDQTGTARASFHSEPSSFPASSRPLESAATRTRREGSSRPAGRAAASNSPSRSRRWAAGRSKRQAIRCRGPKLQASNESLDAPRAEIAKIARQMISRSQHHALPNRNCRTRMVTASAHRNVRARAPR